MLYRWAVVLEKNQINLTDDGEIETHQMITKKGEMEETENGQNVVLAVVETTKKIGNLVHIEVMQV